MCDFVIHLLKCLILIKPFTPTDQFSLIQSNDWKRPLSLISVERVKQIFVFIKSIFNHTSMLVNILI